MRKTRMGEWIEWSGGERPVDPEQKVECILRSGGKAGIASAVWFTWEHRASNLDIVSYRIIEANDRSEAGTDIEQTLEQRGNRYGEFKESARITQSLKRAMADSPNWEKLSDDKREALEMLAHKVGRILNGDPEFADSWHDIIGYTKLVENNLLAELGD